MANTVELVFGADQVRTTNQVISDLQKIAKKVEASGATKLKFSLDTQQTNAAAKSIQAQSQAIASSVSSSTSKYSKQLIQYYKDLDKQNTAFNNKNLNGIDLEIKKRELAAKQFSSSLKSQMQQEQVLQTQKNSFNQKNLNGIDYEIKQREIAGKEFSAQLQSQMQQEKQFEIQQEKDHTKEVRYRLQNNKILEQERNYYERYSSSIKKNSELNAEWQEKLSLLSNRKLGAPQEARDVMTALERKTREAGLQVETLRDRIQRLFGIHLSTALTMVGVHLLMQSFQQMITNVIDINSAMTQLKIVTQDTDAVYKKFGEDAADAAEKIGASVSEILSSTETYARLGYSLQNSLELSTVTAKYANVAATTVDAATSSITAILKGFGLQAKDAEGVADILTLVGQKYAISASELGAALERGGAALEAGGNSLQQSAALMAAGNAAIQDADKTGTAAKTLAMRLRGASADELEEANADTDGLIESTSKLREEIKGLSGVDIMIDDKNFKSTYQIMVEISKVWDKLSDINRAALLEDIAGKRQATVVSSIIQNIGDLQGAYEDASNASGTLEKANTTYLDSIEGKSKQFKATFQELSTTVANSNIIKGVISGSTGLISALNKLLSFGNGIIPKVTLLTVAVIALSKAQTALNLSYTNSTGRHKMICLINMPVNDLVVTRNELIA